MVSARLFVWLAGTLTYMAPELLEGHVAELSHPHATDIFRCAYVPCTASVHSHTGAQDSCAHAQLWRHDARGCQREDAGAARSAATQACLMWLWCTGCVCVRRCAARSAAICVLFTFLRLIVPCSVTPCGNE